jgi:hypothetical protein
MRVSVGNFNIHACYEHMARTPENDADLMLQPVSVIVPERIIGLIFRSQAIKKSE